MKNNTSPIRAALLCFAALALGSLSAMAQYQPRDLTIPPGVDPEMVKDAGNQAIQELLTDMLSRQDLPVRKLAVLPLERDVDSGYFTMQLRNHFVSLGGSNKFELYTRSDEEWNTLLNEIRWGQNFGDTMAPETVQKFGRIQGVQGLIMGRISSITTDPQAKTSNTVRVRVSIQLFEVETGRLLWGQEKMANAGASKEWWITTWGRRALFDEPSNSGRVLLYGALLLGLLVVLGFVLRAVLRAARPR